MFVMIIRKISYLTGKLRLSRESFISIETNFFNSLLLEIHHVEEQLFCIIDLTDDPSPQICVIFMYISGDREN